MHFVDQIEITVQAGNGGAGAVSFRREKFVPKGGPDGGNGGKGGDIIVKASSNLQSLLDFKLKQSHKAPNGEAGKKKKKFGSDGQDLVLKVPCGTLIFDEEDTLLFDLKENDQEVILAKGGLGGKGNALFATSINQTPLYAQSGIPGELKRVRLELRMIAQVGLVGLPNAGKSTLLNALTNAHSKVGDYPFTTLYPNLGVIHFDDLELLVADIPGLIEGASQGQGLGAEFLRHIDRTEIMCHLVAVKETKEETYEDYQVIESELKKSRYEFASKKKRVLLSKIDLIPEEERQSYIDYFHEKNTSVMILSAATREGLSELKYELYQLYKDKEGK